MCAGLSKVLKRRANLLYRLRRNGVDCSLKRKTIYLPFETSPMMYPQIKRLCNEYHFDIQYVII